MVKEFPLLFSYRLQNVEYNISHAHYTEKFHQFYPLEIAEHDLLACG